MAHITSLTPNFMVKDVKKSVQFYTNILGFHLIMAVPESQNSITETISDDMNIIYALVQNGDINIMLQEEASLKKDLIPFVEKEMGASVSFYFDVKNIQEVYESLKKQAPVIKELFTTWYGMNEFYIEDPDGYILGFAEAKK